jgi:hypothetical protein
MRLLRVALAALLPAATAASGAGAQQLMHLVDDRGKAIVAPLEICFQLGLRSDCRRVSRGEEVRAPASFYGVRIEGPDHGPLDLHREQLAPQPDGSLRIVVARKALLDVLDLPRTKPEPPAIGGAAVGNRPLTVSLHAAQDRDFREPVFRAQLQPGRSSLRVPAGDFVASLTMAPFAPDLRRLTARPAARVRLAYRQRPGWSLVVRCRAGSPSRPLRNVEVKLSAALGFGLAEPLIAGGISGADGLVLVSGIEATMVSLAARHPDLLPGRAAGVLAAPGTFTFQEVELLAGGRLRVVVSLHGRPVPAAGCAIYGVAAAANAGRQEPQPLWRGDTNATGMCRSGLLAQGLYKLLVQMPQGTGQVLRWVSVPAAQEIEEDLVLAPTRVVGKVRRGTAPAAAYRVKAAPRATGAPPGAYTEFPYQATSDEEGNYELTLWVPGAYLFGLSSPSGAAVSSHRELSTDGDEEKKLDFNLAGGSLAGAVVDDRGRPLAEAWVVIHFQGLMTRLPTDGQGRFGIDLEGSGPATLSAGKTGYSSSDSLDLQIAEDQPISPVTLVLRKDTSAQGTLLTAAGAPVLGGWVASVTSTSPDGPRLYAFTRTGADGGFAVGLPPGSPHLFASGPGCPLSDFELPPAARSDAGDGEDAPAPVLRCPALPAAVQLTLADEKGQPIAHAALILRHQGTIVPQSVLAAHLTLLGLSPDTDGAGHVVVAGLSPGDYDFFANTASSEETIAAGRRDGYLTSVSLPALATTELQLTLVGPPARP